jgi:hypothetical protein
VFVLPMHYVFSRQSPLLFSLFFVFNIVLRWKRGKKDEKKEVEEEVSFICTLSNERKELTGKKEPITHLKRKIGLLLIILDNHRQSNPMSFIF